MIKKRIVGCVPVKGGVVVQSIQFKRYLPVGRPSITIEFLNIWGIDEIVILDLDATREGRGPDFELIRDVSRKCYAPLTVGGGVRDLSDMTTLIHSGADKISINNLALEQPEIIKEASHVFGNQCIVVSIDVHKNDAGDYEVFGDSGKTATGLHPVELARKVETLGAGEIFLNSIDRDGCKKGYDIKLINLVSDAVTIPVIACGGVGHSKHILAGLTHSSASACAVGNFFHFTEHSVITAKSYIRKKFNIRLGTYAQYENYSYDDGRVAKRADDELEQLRFQYHPDEVI